LNSLDSWFHREHVGDLSQVAVHVLDAALQGRNPFVLDLVLLLETGQIVFQSAEFGVRELDVKVFVFHPGAGDVDVRHVAAEAPP